MGGNDTLFGMAGDDRLFGGDGSDVLYGGTGHDRLWMDDGNDILFGGAGRDWVMVGARAATIDLSRTDAQLTGYGVDRFDPIEHISGGAGADRLTGSSVRNILIGGAGDDVLWDLRGNDRLEGGSGNDQLRGGTGRDYLTGGSGNDTLIGGSGSDTMTGGSGADHFVFTALSDMTGRDRIVDFQRGVDRIDLSGVDARVGRGDDAFHWIGQDDFTAAGQARYSVTDGVTTVFLNTDADLDADASFTLRGDLHLTAADFIL
ncbi:calcium-binding protein [Paracoccus sp. (in: a-proteobacteria)]|uniref:calcium-binding protein n=1 Tax=Paracoccus sp. TaxID=267 RepID=UPI0026DF249A|nr:calcium-binding protein [Paracoccus sp. (in: a-proteobacteria)]MDO5647597.1 calcium-binding protein [Paracoccus sp. (in: a-proteobacteria)]